MDEKTNELKNEATVDKNADNAEVETAEASENLNSDNLAYENANEPQTKQKKPKNKKLNGALLRAGAAFLAAIILLVITSPSLIALMKGAEESESFQDEEIGSFVKRDIFAILGTYGDEEGQYAVVPMGGNLVTVHLTNRYLASAKEVESDTNDYISGSLSGLDRYFIVEGTTETISEEVSGQFYAWFDENKESLVQEGVLLDTDDNSVYLSDVIFEVDQVKSMSETLVFVLTGLAGLCLIYIVVEFILMAVGVYLPEEEKKAKKAAAEAYKKTAEPNFEATGAEINDNEADENAQELGDKAEEEPEDDAEKAEADDNGNSEDDTNTTEAEEEKE